MHARLQNLQGDVTAEIGTACCYARSDKYWTTDPQGVAWESFHTLGDIPVFGKTADDESECCAPTAADQPQNTAQCCVPVQFAKAKPGTCC
jgi:hypothetical protein